MLRKTVIVRATIRTYVRSECECHHTARAPGGGVPRYLARMPRERADTVIAARGLTRSRASAAQAIRAGRVTIGAGGARIAKPSELIEADAELTVAEGRDFASRGGRKLDNALQALGLDGTGLDCLDVGASTGGFTDCLLRRGANRVIALDVAHGQLDWTLRNDDRVHVIERLNARELRPSDLPFAPALVTIDVSFISLAKVLPAVVSCAAPDAQVLAMVKPQFELGRRRVKAGVVRDPADRREAIASVVAAARDLGLVVRGIAPSGLPGPKGNRETFIHAGRTGAGLDPDGVEAAILEVEP